MLGATNTKRCNRCDAEKPRSEFSADRRNRDGLQGRCKSCVAELNRTDYADRAKQWRQSDRGKTFLRAAHRRYIDTEHGREVMNRVQQKSSRKYGHSPAGKLTSVRYQASAKGLASIERAKLRRMNIL